MNSKRLLTTAMLIGALALPLAAQPAPDTKNAGTPDAVIQQKIEKQLQSDRFKDVTASVDDGNIALNGTVKKLKDKIDLEKKASKIDKHLTSNVQVAEADVSDQKLFETLAKKLRNDRWGYDQVWNAISIGVNHGVVTVQGLVREPIDKDSALSAIENTPGVKSINDQLQVAPASPMDDDIRMRVARAIYGYGPLQRYAIDPNAPIRIAVANGHVALYGVVDNKMDRQLAEMRADQVPFVFSVTDHLQVANQER
jgi:hyperosmotically inducible periplasmic protein